MLQTNATILIADDDRAIRAVLSSAGRVGHRSARPAALQRWQWVQAGDGDLVITDVHMPDGDGLELVLRIRAVRPDMSVIVMSAQNTLVTVVKATDRGAFEYLPKPFDLTELLNAVERGLAQPTQRATAAKEFKERQEDRETGRLDRLPLIGRSGAMQDIYRVIARLVKTDLTALITGESGTGKELIARALHDFSRRREAPFVAVNMAAIPKELIESELFGHEKGSFTGANSRFDGKFSQAQYGTLFLDEIGDMPQEAQTAAAGAAGRRVHPDWRQPEDQGRRPHRRRHPPGSDGGGQGGAVPRRPVLPHQRGAGAGATSARAAR